MWTPEGVSNPLPHTTTMIEVPILGIALIVAIGWLWTTYQENLATKERIRERLYEARLTEERLAKEQAHADALGKAWEALENGDTETVDYWLKHSRELERWL